MRSRLFTLFTLAAVSLLIGGCGSSRESDGATTVAATPEAIARATAFVGADRCGGCHETMHTGWAATAHTKKLRDGSVEMNYANDMQGTTASGRSDFFDGTDFDLGIASNATAFAVYGANAPILGSDGGQAYVKIGGVKYDINYTLGGGGHDDDADGFVLNDEATWKQRYITKVGKSNYILPVQYNQQTQEYSVYHGSDWYDADNLPLAAVIKNQSYERRCAGCHVTGLEVALDGDEWTMEFSDISVSCEACHGPGGQHATSPNKDNIVNPATMTTDLDLNADGAVDTVDNLIVRNYVCYACHTRGDGYTSEAAATKLGYPSKGDSDSNIQMYIPGMDWKDYYTVTDSAYWGGTLADGFITSKKHHQQQQDLDNGPHGPDKAYDHECFVCHDMHSTQNDSMVVTTIEGDGLQVEVASASDNSLCLTCHATHGDFASVEVFDVKTNLPSVQTAVFAHMAKRAGKVATQTWITCTSCHMPKTAKSAVNTEVATGELDENGDPIMEVVAGDVASHTFEIIWPSQSVANPGLPNSCNGCHNGTASSGDNKDDGTVILRDWANSGHGDETAEAWKHYDWDEGDEATTAGSRQSCQKCHTATGSMNFLTDPVNYDAANNSFGLAEGKNQVLYCYACHSKTASGDGFGTAVHAPGAIELSYTVDDVNPTMPDLGASNVCINCHSGRGNMDSLIGAADADPAGAAVKGGTKTHYMAAAGTIYQSTTRTGYEYAGQSYTDKVYFAHNSLGCADCHMDSTESHSFDVAKKDATGVITSINADICVTCHTGEHALFVSQALVGTTANIWDGISAAVSTTVTQAMADAAAAELEHESHGYHNALDALEAELATAGTPSQAGYPYFSGDATDQGHGGAMHNWSYLHHEAGAYAHNRYYAKRLIFDSIDWLTSGAAGARAIDSSISLDPATYAAAIEWLGGDTVTGIIATRP